MTKKLIYIFQFIFGFCLLSTNVFASETLAVRVEQPKTPTNQTTFRLNFVALDTKENNGPVTVRCFKKGPSDVSFSQFDTDMVLKVGGNSGYCTVANSTLSSNGTFQFKVVATSDITVESSIVSVDYNSSTPGTPSNYSKEKSDSCQYTIKFRTDNDNGRTTRVVLYRSDQKSFTADSGSQVESRGVGSNQEVTITNGIPDCNKTYFYSVRAFDDFGNGSSLVGDSETTFTITNTTNGSQAGVGAIALRGTSSQVAPEKGSDGVTASVSGQSTDTTGDANNQTVLGVSTDRKFGIAKWALLIAGIPAIYFLFKAVQRSKSK